MEKQERKNRKILTNNRLSTINKREMSFEGLAGTLESGEDGVYNLINQDKNQLLQPHISITKKDLEEIPPLRQLHDTIAHLKEVLPRLSGKAAYITKRNIIDLSKDQYLIKESFRKPVTCQKSYGSKFYLSYEDKTTLGPDNLAHPDGITLTNPEICCFILCNYSKLKESCEEAPQSDLWCLMEDFDRISSIALADSPLYEAIVTYKIDGMKNNDLALQLQVEFGIKHTPEYLSCLWRQKIPKMIASVAEDEWLNWYFLEIEKGKYKKCNCCGQIKLANNKNFSKNKTSKDSFYSICKSCRNAKARAKKELKLKNE